MSGPFLVLTGVPGGVPPPPILNAVGINALSSINYYSLEQPLLDVMKMANTAGAYDYSGLNGAWLTSSGSVANTGEEGYLQLDSNGWPTSLVAGNGFSPGGSNPYYNVVPSPPVWATETEQQFTFAQIWIYTLISGTLPAGASEWFNPGPYTMKLTGAGTGSGTQVINLNGASSVSVLSGGSYVTAAGAVLTCNLGSSQVATVQFTMGSNGVQVQITSMPNNQNYVTIPYCVPSSLLSEYLAGELLNPDWKAAVTANGAGCFGVIRMMGALQTYSQEFNIVFTANLASGATSGTIASLQNAHGDRPVWPFNTGTMEAVFATGQVITVSGVYGSAALTWSTPLSAAITTAAIGGMAFIAQQPSWASRPLVGNCAWSGPGGIPAEAYMQICNELGIDCWTNIPAATSLIDGTYFAGLAALAFNGTGANVTGWNVSSFSGVTNKIIPEYSNETWNFSQYQETYFCSMMGVVAGFYAAQGNNEIYGAQEWYGTQCAGIGDAFYAAYGSQFAARCAPVMMNQTGSASSNGVAFMKVAMNTPDWTSRAYTHHIAGYGYAPYFGPTNGGANYGGMNNADATTIAALGDPLTELYSLVYTNKGASGNTYGSVSTSGFIGAILAQQASAQGVFSGQPWGSLPVYCYEGGLDRGNYSGYSGLTTYLNQMLTDSRSAYLYYDPTHQLSALGTGYLPGLTAIGVSFVNMLELTGGNPSNVGQWALMTVITQMESTPPYTNMPQLAGIIDYAEA